MQVCVSAFHAATMEAPRLIRTVAALRSPDVKAFERIAVLAATPQGHEVLYRQVITQWLS